MDNIVWIVFGVTVAAITIALAIAASGRDELRRRLDNEGSYRQNIEKRLERLQRRLRKLMDDE